MLKKDSISSDFLSGCLIFVLLALIALGILGWGYFSSHADRAAVRGWGRSHHVEHYSGGKMIGAWNTTGQVENEKSSDGYFFQDLASGNPVVISGEVQVTLRD